MKVFTNVFSLFILAVFSQFTLKAQTPEITWSLTSSASASTSVNLIGSNVIASSGLTAFQFSSADGIGSTGWGNTINTDLFYEYTITTPSTRTFVVSQIAFYHDDNGGNSSFRVSYSKDNFANITYVNSTTTVAKKTTVNLTGLAIQMTASSTLKIRVYSSNSTSGKTYYNKDFRIYGSGAQATLPVTLSNFTAKQTTDNKVALSWVTSSESVNKGFSIERQEEGSGKFQSLGFIASKAEGGNSQSTLAYSFKDVTAKNGNNMYRLVQEDLDGKKTYSEVRVVKLSGQSVSNVFPNPSNGAINISRTNDGKKMNIQVLDLSGRVISQVNNITDANYRMNLPQSGIYSIKMMYPETGEQSTQRIVVQK